LGSGSTSRQGQVDAADQGAPRYGSRASSAPRSAIDATGGMEPDAPTTGRRATRRAGVRRPAEAVFLPAACRTRGFFGGRETATEPSARDHCRLLRPARVYSFL